MKEIRYQDDWRFDIDEKKTRDFYTNITFVQFPKLKEIFPNTSSFLEEMGVDIRKPIDFSEEYKDELTYIVFGTAKTTTGFELDFYEPQNFTSIVVYPYPSQPQNVNDRIKKYVRDINTAIILLDIFVGGDY